MVEGVNVYVIKDQIQMIIVDIALDLILAGVPEASFWETDYSIRYDVSVLV